MKKINPFLKIAGSIACLTLAIITSSCSSDEVSTTETTATETKTNSTETTAKVTSSKVTDNYKIQIGTTSGSSSTTSYYSLDDSGVSSYCYISGDDLVMTMNKGESTRSELRGLSEYDYNDTAYQQTKSYITKTLGSEELCVAQLHRNGDNDQPFFMLVVVDGKFRYKQNSHKTDTNNTETKKYLDSDVTFSTSHMYKITLQMSGGKLTFSLYDYTDATHYTESFTISSTNFGSSGYYFKTGVYNQGTGTSKVKINTLYTGTGTAKLSAY